MSDQILYAGTITLPASATWWSTVWGAVGVTNGLATVSGVNLNNGRLVAGQSVSFANQSGTVYVISSIDSATQITLTTAFTGATNAATAMGFSANPSFRVSGQSRIKGYVFSSVAPGTIQYQLSQDGTNWDFADNLTLDASPSVGCYSFDINLLGQPFFRLVFTDAGAGSTGRVLLYTFDGGSGPTILSSGSSPSGTIFVKDAPLTPLGTNQFSVDGTTARGLGFGSSIPTGARYAQVCLDTGGTNVACRFRYDGTAPTSAVGMILNAGVLLPVETTPLSSFNIIGTGAGPTTVNVSFFS